MSIQTELTRLTNAKAAIKTAIEGKGVTVPEATLLDGMASLIESIEAGGGGGGADISPWKDIVTFSLTPAEDLTGYIDFTSFISGRTKPPHIFILGNRATTSSRGYVQIMYRISTLSTYTRQRLYFSANDATTGFPTQRITNGRFEIGIGTYKLEAGVPYWGVMLWRE